MYFRATDRLLPIMTAMKTGPVPGDRDALVSEIERYLAAVEVFRDQGYEPRWLSGEPAPYAQTAAMPTPALLVAD